MPDTDALTLLRFPDITCKKKSQSRNRKAFVIYQVSRSGEPAVTVLPQDEPFAGVGLYGIRHADTQAGTDF